MSMIAPPDWLDVSDAVASAIGDRRPVVALESTLIAHGLPWPTNVETAVQAEEEIRAAGAVPATIAVWSGRPTIGLTREQISELARMPEVLKASRRDIATAILQRRTAATTVAGTSFLAHAAGIHVFATGGIGGAHRDLEEPFDISADLVELARTPVLVVCAGAKSILHLPRTFEILESLGVPVVGYRTDTFPAFYVRDSGLPLPARVDSPMEAALLWAMHRRLMSTTSPGGMLLCQPVAEDVALRPEDLDSAISVAQSEAAAQRVRGPALTPLLLARLAELTHGRSLLANRALIVANARLAAEVAVAFAAA
jgi:pseudouridine-5'-phosphate glycosidase